MDSHLLRDALTLSAVAILLIILLVAKVAKKRKELASTKSYHVHVCRKDDIFRQRRLNQ